VRTLCSAVLGFEAVVVLLAIVPALALVPDHHGAIVGVGLGVAALCIVSAALMRTESGLVLGSTTQVAVVAWGFVLPAMFVLGVVFAGLWVAAVVLGRRADGYAARRTSPQPATDDPPTTPREPGSPP
jgi:hypothetical protein